MEFKKNDRETKYQTFRKKNGNLNDVFLEPGAIATSLSV
jgi:hypothetical protein